MNPYTTTIEAPGAARPDRADENALGPAIRGERRAVERRHGQVQRHDVGLDAGRVDDAGSRLGERYFCLFNRSNNFAELLTWALKPISAPDAMNDPTVIFKHGLP